MYAMLRGNHQKKKNYGKGVQTGENSAGFLGGVLEN